MGIKNVFKTVKPLEIESGGCADVTIGFIVEPDIISKPSDIIILLDISSSINSIFEYIQNATINFIDSIVKSTGSSNNIISGGTKIGLVTFSDIAKEEQELTNNADILKTKISFLNTEGISNIRNGLVQASKSLNTLSSNKKIILISDGNWSDDETNDIIGQLENDNVETYVIAIDAGNGLNEMALKNFASNPYSYFYINVNSALYLQQVLCNLADSISSPGPTEAYIYEKVTSDFQIISISIPSHGSATLTSPRSLRWDIGSIGQDKSELISLTFRIKHISSRTGDLSVNQSIHYYDNNCNSITFSDIIIKVASDDCDKVLAEPSQTKTNFTIDSCVDSKTQNLNSYEMQSLGRVLQLNVRLKNVCPHKKISLAVILYELDENNKKYPRGMKTFIVSSDDDKCSDLCVNCIDFVVPESLVSEVGGDPTTLCNNRRFTTKVIAHYIDEIKCSSEVILC